MHRKTEARNAAIKLRNRLMPAMPVITNARGKKDKILPAVWVYMEGESVKYAIPDGSKAVEIPLEINGIPIIKEAWTGPATKDVQAMALKAFPAGAKK